MDQASFIRTADRASCAYAAAFVATLILSALAVEGVGFGDRGVVGGDFLAFYTAGGFALAGDAAGAYDFATFDAALREFSGREYLGMMWQYPPAMFLVTAPFALLPYKLSYFVWLLAGWMVFALCLRRFDLRGATFRILIFSPLCVSLLSHGQINTVTAGLLFLAAWKPATHWLVAGLAAGLLTLKPQLGLLIPFAFLAVGAWRAIAVAALCAGAVHAPTLIFFGPEIWPAFADALFRFNAEISGAAAMTPPNGMTTLFGQLKLMGVDGDAARAAQYALSAGLAAGVFAVYRAPVDALAKAAFLSAGAIIAAPYAYGYEMTALALAGLWLARQAGRYDTRLGWSLLAGWALLAMRPFLPGPGGVNIEFLIAGASLILVAIVAYRPTSIDRRAAPA